MASGRRNITDEVIHARDLYVHNGVTAFIDLAAETGLDVRTLKRYAVKENWEAMREDAITTPISIASRLMKIIVRLMDEVDQKIKEGEGISDFTLARLDKISKMAKQLDGRYDEKGLIILANKKLISYANKTNRKALLKELNAVMPDFYRSINAED